MLWTANTQGGESYLCSPASRSKALCEGASSLQLQFLRRKRGKGVKKAWGWEEGGSFQEENKESIQSKEKAKKEVAQGKLGL